MYRRLTVALIPIAISACLSTSTQAIPTIAPAAAVTSTPTIIPLPTATTTPIPTPTITPTPEPYLVQEGYFWMWDGSEQVQLVEADEFVIDDQGNIIVIDGGNMVMVKAAGSQEWKTSYGKWVNVGGALMEWNSSSSELKSVMTIDRDWELGTRKGQVVGVDSEGYTVMMMVERGEATRIYRHFAEAGHEAAVRDSFESITGESVEDAVQRIRDEAPELGTPGVDVSESLYEWVTFGYRNDGIATMNYRGVLFDGIFLLPTRVSLEKIEGSSPGDYAIVEWIRPVYEATREGEEQIDDLIPVLQGFVFRGEFGHNMWLWGKYSCGLDCYDFSNPRQLEKHFRDRVGDGHRVGLMLRLLSWDIVLGEWRDFPFERDQSPIWKEFVLAYGGYLEATSLDRSLIGASSNTPGDEDVSMELMLSIIREIDSPAGFISAGAGDRPF